MFTEPVQFHVQKPTGDLESNGDVSTAVARATLVLNSLTPALARELSPEIEDLCFTKRGAIRDEITNIEVRLREPQKMVTVKMATDSTPHIVLRHVRIPSVKFVKRGEDPEKEVERKSKKVAPAGETLRARFSALILPENDATCRFLLQMAPGKTFFFEFEDEQEQMDFGPTPGDDDGDDDGPKEQPLDFSGRARKAKAITDKQVIQALAENAVELKPEQIARMNPAQRGEVLVWAQACRLERDKGGDVFTFPPAPSFVLKPAELMGPPPPVAEAGDVLETPKKVKAARAPKPRGKFTNTPRVTKAKKGKK